MTRDDVTEKLLGIKREKGWTWKYNCSEIGGMSPILITGAILGQMKLTKPRAANAAKVRCCPKASCRGIPRSIYEEARDVARALANAEAFEQSRRDRKRIEMLFAHLKRILKVGCLRLRGPRRTG